MKKYPAIDTESRMRFAVSQKDIHMLCIYTWGFQIMLIRHHKGQYTVCHIRDFQMRLQKQLKLFLSYFLQVSIVRGSVVTPWLSTRKMFFSVTRAKKRYAKSAKQKLEHLKTSIMSPPIQFQNNAELLRSQPFWAGSTNESLKSKLSVTLGHLQVDRNCRQLLLSFENTSKNVTVNRVSTRPVSNVGVTYALTVSVNLCKEWANLELRGIALTEVKSQ